MEKPISYGPPMMAARLARRKAETRRSLPDSYIINQEPGRYKCHGIDNDNVGTRNKPVVLFEDLRPDITPWIEPIPCPWAVGDWLYTKEAYYTLAVYNTASPAELPADAPIHYAADGPKPEGYGRYRHARFMPKRFARFWDELTAVHCERVQDITREAAIAEGIEPILNTQVVTLAKEPTQLYRIYTRPGYQTPHPVSSYQSLWQSINGPASWERNDWIFVLQFKELSRTGHPDQQPAPTLADNFVPAHDLALTEELQALLQQYPGQGPAVLAAYELGLGNLREVLSTFGQPRQPGQREGGAPGRCISLTTHDHARKIKTRPSHRNPGPGAKRRHYRHHGRAGSSRG